MSVDNYDAEYAQMVKSEFKAMKTEWNREYDAHVFIKSTPYNPKYAQMVKSEFKAMKIEWMLEYCVHES